MSQHKVVGSYVITRKIGRGSFAEVYRGYHHETGNEVAIKAIARDRLNKKLQENLKHEINILRNFRHPNILELYDVVTTDRSVYLVMELCNGGDLARLLRKRGALPEATARHFLAQLARGLEFLWQRSYMHRDLKPQNLLLTSSDEKDATLKLADFGFARYIQPLAMAETLCGSPLYMAPEILHHHKYDARADLWSVGAILFEMVTGRPPFVGQNQYELLQNIEKSSLVFPKEVIVSEQCLDLLRGLLRREATERLPYTAFFNHPFLQEGSISTDIQEGNPTEEAVPNPPTTPPGPLRTNIFRSHSEPMLDSRIKEPLRRSTIDLIDVTTQQQRLHPSPAGLPTPSPPPPPFSGKTSLYKPRTTGPPSSAVPPAPTGATAFVPSSPILKPKTNPFKERLEYHGSNESPLPSSGGGSRQSPSTSDADFDVQDYVIVATMSEAQSQTDPPSSSSDTQTIVTLERLGERARVITLLGDRQMDAGRAAYGLSLIHKALLMLRRALNFTQKLQPDERARRGAMIQNAFVQAVKRAESWQNAVSPQQVALVVPDKVIYEGALELGREAAHEEFLGQLEKSQEGYWQAQLLLETLLMDPQMDESDKGTLQQFVHSFAHRVEETAKKMSRRRRTTDPH